MKLLKSPPHSITVNIGEVKVIENSTEVAWTVLGSCVSAIFYAGSGLSLICHAQMPFRSSASPKCYESCPDPCFSNLHTLRKFKYVSCSLEYMIDYLKNAGINPRTVKTTLVGGAAVLRVDNAGLNIGLQNVQEAKRILNRYRITIDRELTGGTSGITLWFYPENGTLLYKKHGTKWIRELKAKPHGKKAHG